ncbi:hypothetical protein MIZ03_3415 [Rhodoferax lithotrophicus]|uniref:MFS transporter n=1 Tax=Rhodoferax lithotrophicus TaxID=2798804 RepID=A0ABN6D8Z1_9BURK|nr:hypothetical protein MIZ03_3415 [Rhodoferax sp. MIZ03]
MSPGPSGLLLDSAASDTQRTLLIVVAIVAIFKDSLSQTAPGVVIGACDRALG